MRGYDGRVAEGLAELIRVGATAGVSTHVSHLRGSADTIEWLFDSASRADVDVTFDAYPYRRGATILAMRALPPRLQQGGPAATVSRLGERRIRDALARGWLAERSRELERCVLAGAPAERFADDEGSTLRDAARGHGLELSEYVCELLTATSLKATCVVPEPRASSETDYVRLLRSDQHMASSDGIYVGGHPHPRGWGAFARVLGRHVRERGDLSWGQAAWRLAGHAAQRFGLAGRGRLAAGFAADVVVLDPDGVTDTATYERPVSNATGVRHVFVNGTHVVRDGALRAGLLAGRALRRGERPT
jgi:N-acyl-D-amino-acid deacylase